MLRYAYLAIISAVSILGLCGCQTFTPQNMAPPYTNTELQQRLSNLKYWKAEGKIAFTYADKRQNANFNWQQYNKNYNIHIFGPFGAGSTWLKRTSRSVTLENAKLGSHSATSIEQLMETLVGWQVPVSNMQYWIKGVIAPTNRNDAANFGAATSEKDENGLIRIIQQQGWRVEITQYQTHGRWKFPRKIIATREQMRLMVVIKQWQPRTNSAWF